MIIALEEFAFRLHADWITHISPCFRPTCWPPSREWVVSEDIAGNVISRWGDPIWDFSHIVGKPLTLNFGDGPAKIASTIDPENADILRLITTWFLWGHRTIKTGSNLTQAFQSIRPIIALCSNNGILASDLMRFPKVFEQVAGLIAPSHYNTTLTRLHKVLDAKAVLGFILVDTEGLKRLANANPNHTKIQTAYIPPRIWKYQITRLRECLDDYLNHQQSIENCFNFCLDAYAHNSGSLSNALTTRLIQSRQPFTASNAERRTTDVFYGPFQLTAERFGINGLLEKWLDVDGERIELRNLSSYLTLIQWAGLAYIANFTLQRISEAASLRADCLQFEIDEKLGKITIICGETTKTIQESDARWPTSPSVLPAIEAMRHVAKLRMRCIGIHPFISSTTKELDNPYLFLKSFEPWTPKQKITHYSLNRPISNYDAVIKKFPKLFNTQELTITEDDSKLARMLTPNLCKSDYAVGNTWPLAWHQLRRTGAVNMFASGMLSDSSMQFIMKHSSRIMPLYYGRGYTKLHLNEDVESLVTTTMYEVMAKSMLTAMGDRFVSPRSADQKQTIVVNLIGDKNAKDLAKAARRGEVFYRETRLGACTSRTLCSYGGIESIARCAGGDGHKPCVDVLYDRAKTPDIEKSLRTVSQELAKWPVGSPRHNALLMERKGLENFLDAVKN